MGEQMVRKTKRSRSGDQRYTNIKGKRLHTLFCECGRCDVKPRHYRRALRELKEEQ